MLKYSIKRLAFLCLSILVSTPILASNQKLRDLLENYRTQKKIEFEKAEFESSPRFHNSITDQNLRLMSQANFLYQTKSYGESRKFLNQIKKEELPFQNYLKFLRLDYMLYLKQGNFQEIRKRLITRSKDSKYMIFLEEGSVFSETLSLIKKNRKLTTIFLNKSVAAFPKSEASIKAFQYLQTCEADYSLKFHQLMNLARLTELVPGLDDWILSLLEQDRIDYGRSKQIPFLQARLLRRLGRFDRVEGLLENLDEKSQDSMKPGRLANLAAHMYLDRDLTGKGFSWYYRIANSPKLSYLQRKRLAFNLAEHGYFREAGTRFESLKKVTGSRSVRWAYFWSLYRSEQYTKALRRLNRNRTPPLDPASREMLTYWKSVVLDKLGQKRKSEIEKNRLLEKFPDSIYAIALTPRAVDGDPRPSESASGNFLNDDIFDQRKWLEGRTDRIKSMRKAKKAKEPDLLNSLEKNEFPKPYRNWVETVSGVLGLDSHLVFSIMRAESFYNPYARSLVGAMGFLQIMPLTAFRISLELQDENFKVEDLEDPRINLLYGIYYIDKLLRAFDGNKILAVGSYNAGPDAMMDWIRHCLPCNSMELVESVNYRETRRYIKKVIGFYGRYSKVYSGRREFSINKDVAQTVYSGRLY